jgi:hypothetical protein
MQATATAKGYGPVDLRGRFNRIKQHLALSVELSEFPLGEAAVPAAQRFAPELAPHLAKFTATANVKAELLYTPDTPAPWWHKVTLQVKDARFEHPELPWPIEKISARVQSENGHLTVENASAQVGQAKVRLSLETRTDVTPPAKGAPAADPLRRIEDNLQKLEISAAGIALDDGLFEHLPEKLKRGRKMFSPTGQVDIAYKFTHEGAGWKRELEVRPKQAGMVYEKFRYPVSDVRGLIKRTITHTGSESTTFNLVGTAAGQPISLVGRIEGEGPNPAVSLRIIGQNVPLNEQLCAAFPPKYAALVREFRASGRGDFVAEITQRAGMNLSENEFRIDIKDGKLNYTAFPYALEKLKGRLVIRTTTSDPDRPRPESDSKHPLPDRDEIIFDNFTAVHAGAPIWMNGARRQLPNSRDRKLVVHVGANSLPLDADLKAALATAKIDSMWSTLSPKGTITFGADVEVLDRAPSPERPDFDPPMDPSKDLKLTLNFSGPTVTPTFFRYELTDLTGWLEYKNDRVDLAHLSARHGISRVKLNAADVRFYPDGVVWANLGGFEMKPCIPDAALKKALPGKLGSAIDELQFKGGAELLVKHLVVLTPAEQLASTPVVPAGAVARGQLGPVIASVPSPTPPEPRPDPIVYWDAELKLFGASLDTGVPWEDTFGSIACHGRYEGTHVGAVRGNIWLDRAIISRMPVTAARCQMKADAQTADPARPGQYLPTTLQFLNITGDLFHGALGGQARVVLTGPTQYVVWITATDAQLEEVARHYKLSSNADLKGIAQAQLLVYNKLDPKTGQLVVEGKGNIDVPTGRMYNLPILLELVKVFKLQTPDKTAFEQAHAVFRIQGDRLKVDQLDLIGKAICVGGSGELDLTGDYVKFEFYTVWSQVLKQMINTPVGDLTAFLSKNLFTIKMVRENGELKYKPEPVPLVTEPAKNAIERLKRAGGKVFGK